MTTRLPTYFISHGGGPWPWLPDMRPAMHTLEVSLRDAYDPEEHIALGRGLEPLRDEGVLIVGSSLSYHNLRRSGAAENEKAVRVYHDENVFGGVTASSYRFG